MTTTLVLGGGGPVGIAWETGLLVSLAEAGVDVSRSDRVIGTSAGSETTSEDEFVAGFDELAGREWPAALVVTVTALDVPTVGDPRFARMQEQRNEEIERLCAVGCDVEVIGPGDEFREVSGMGMFLMDTSRVAAAFEAGLRQGTAEAVRLSQWWQRAAVAAP